eukprot:4098219-Amphidinium_carterae.2
MAKPAKKPSCAETCRIGRGWKWHISPPQKSGCDRQLCHRGMWVHPAGGRSRLCCHAACTAGAV